MEQTLIHQLGHDSTPNGGGGLIVQVGGNVTIGSGGKITAEGQGVDSSLKEVLQALVVHQEEVVF